MTSLGVSIYILRYDDFTLILSCHFAIFFYKKGDESYGYYY